MKTVKVIKEQHRRDVWMDDDDYIWFFDADLQDWIVLSPVPGAVKRIRNCPGSGFGPYTRILKGWR